MKYRHYAIFQFNHSKSRHQKDVYERCDINMPILFNILGIINAGHFKKVLYDHFDSKVYNPVVPGLLSLFPFFSPFCFALMRSFSIISRCRAVKVVVRLKEQQRNYLQIFATVTETKLFVPI